MRIWIAADVELERLLEHVLVAAGRRIEQTYRLACANLLSVHDRVARAGACKLDNRGGPAHDFFDRGFDQCGIGLEPTELFGVFEQREQAATGRIAVVSLPATTSTSK